MASLVYRGGSPTDDNLTPRPGADTTVRDGQAPGLSVFTTIEAAVGPGGKAQLIDLDLLVFPLMGFPDDPIQEQGDAIHISICPADEGGRPDLAKLAEWASTRRTDRLHPLTAILRSALVQENVRRPP